MEQFQYLALLAGSLAFTIPLEFVYGFKVWRDPKRLLRALLPGFVLFMLWDLVAIGRDHWFFSDEYTIGVRIPGGMPIEEVLFFLVIPACGISAFEAVRAQFARWNSTETKNA